MIKWQRRAREAREAAEAAKKAKALEKVARKQGRGAPDAVSSARDGLDDEIARWAAAAAAEFGRSAAPSSSV